MSALLSKLLASKSLFAIKEIHPTLGLAFRHALLWLWQRSVTATPVISFQKVTGQQERTSRKLILLLVIIASAAITGCGTKSTYIATPGVPAVNWVEGFKVGQVEDNSGFKFKPDDKDAFSLKEAMSTALGTALAKKGLSGEGYLVNVNILAYAPGSAFTRWIIPGAGATELSVEAMLMDNKGAMAAKIPVYRHISAGGGFTIGAYKSIFEDVAQTIAAVIKDQTKANGPGLK